MADLREAARLGIISEALLAEFVKGRRAAAAEVDAIVARSTRQRKQAVSLENLRFYEAIARREMEVARMNADEPATRKAELVLAHFERRIAEAAEQRVTAKDFQTTTNPGKFQAPAEAIEPLFLVRELRRVEKDLRAVATSSRLVSKNLICELDTQLCLTWDNVAPPPLSSQEGPSSRMGGMNSYNAGRLLSARNAEKVAMRYYENLGCEVEDISATQLSWGSDSWKDFDIRADGRCVDVKNARESLHGNGQYVEHSVAKFKLARESGAHVSILGVVSPYISDIDRYFSSPQVATVLGEVDAAQMGALLNWTRVRFKGRLELREPSRAGFLPGWLFEFPPAHYPGRQAAIEAVPDILRQLLEALAYSCEIPGWLWVFSNERIPEVLPAAAVLGELRRLHEAVGISRRSLYVLALGLAIEELDGEGDGESKLTGLMEACQLSTGGVERHGRLSPLGLDDPLAYVHNLITTLLEIVATLRNRHIEIVGFRLVSPSILQGIGASGERITLLAYCGGWQRRPILARCGKSPLCIAHHATCPSCSHLICDNCGHCSDECDDCEARQAAIITEFDRAAINALNDPSDGLQASSGDVPF